MQDFRYAIRMLLKHPGSTLLAALILALGIGGTTAVVSVADKALLNPFPGRDIKLDRDAYTVVGIMPSNVHFPFGRGQSQFWIPQIFPAEELTRAWDPEDGTCQVIGRLRKGVALKELQAVLDTVAARWLKELHQPNQRWKFQVYRWRGISPTLEKTLWSLQAMVGALLVIACANVGNLLLSRAFSRRGEFGVRMAIGAGRLRIARQLLVESLSLAGVCAALGFFFSL